MRRLLTAAALAAAMGAVGYIERLLTAFDVTPPALHAGGPFSGRRPGATQNDFARFLPLSRVSEAGWRLRLYGSAGVSGGGPNDKVLGPVRGLRERVKQTLAMALAQHPDNDPEHSGDTARLYQCFLSPSGESLVRPGAQNANSIIRQSRKGVRASMDTAMPMRSGLTRLLPDSSNCMSRYSAWLMRSKCCASSNQGLAASVKLSMPASCLRTSGRYSASLAWGENSEIESK